MGAEHAMRLQGARDVGCARAPVFMFVNVRNCFAHACWVAFQCVRVVFVWGCSRWCGCAQGRGPGIVHKSCMPYGSACLHPLWVGSDAASDCGAHACLGPAI